MVYTQTDRERQRYVTHEGPSPLSTFRMLYGIHGEAAAGIQLRAPGVIRTTASGVDRVRAAIALTPGARTTKVGTSYREALVRTGNKKTTAHQRQRGNKQ